VIRNPVIALANPLLVPKAITEEAFVKITGATMNVKIPNGFIPTASAFCHHTKAPR